MLKKPSKIFFSGTGGPISKKLGMKHQWLKYYNVYINHDPVVAFSETNGLISMKLGMKHRWLKYSNVYIYHDHVMTLTKFMARSTWVAYAFEWGKLLKCHLKGKASRKLANGQNIDYSEKKKLAQGLHLPQHWG